MEEKPEQSKKKVAPAGWKTKYEEARKKQLLFKKKAIQLRDSLREVQAELSQKLAELSSLEGELGQAFDSRNQLIQEIDKARQYADGLASQLALQAQELSLSQGKERALLEQLRGREASSTQAQAELQRAMARVDECEGQLGKRYETQRKNTIELKKLRDETRKQRELIQELHAENELQRQSVARLQAQLRDRGRSR